MLLTPASWLVLCCLSWVGTVLGMRDARRVELREQARQMFVHGYEGYMTHAYPADELRPLTCGPLWRDPNPANYGINDVHPNASMTLLDVLSALPLIHPSAFPNAVELVATQVSFDQDVKVQVFEMTIRALGALLSTHQLLDRMTDEEARRYGKELRGYRGRMLDLALDLGKRLLPAFNTPTGLPYARVNLRYGLAKGESPETCTAGAGSLILEFAVLSRLTGDDRFETLSNKAYLAIWNRRSAHNLLGNTIGATHGQWLVPGMSGIGAGMDSFFEYGMKAAILLGDDTYLDIFQDSYAAIQSFVRTSDGFIYRPAQFRLLHPSNPSTIDSLSVFISGVQVLAGDLESAIRVHLVYWNIWRKHSAIPESWDWVDRRVEWAGWPGRPEFVESTFYLFQATRDPFYLRVGERVMEDMRRRTQTSCGFATMKNVNTGALEDRMESFVLSETLKYLYLLFDPTPPAPLTNRVYNTEGHPLYLPHSHLRPPPPARRALHRSEDAYCPVYKPPTLGGGLIVGIEQRLDYEYARQLVFGPGVDGRVAADDERVGWSESGFCSVPIVPRFAMEIVLSPTIDTDPADLPPADPSPSLSKVWQDASGDFVIADSEGIRLGVRWRFDNNGYDVSSIGPHRIRPGQHVVVTDPKMSSYLPVPPSSLAASHETSEIMLRFSGDEQVFLHAMGATATFGRSFVKPADDGWRVGGGPIRLLRTGKGGDQACEPLETIRGEKPFVLMVERGGCTFLDKLAHATRAGAVGVLVYGNPPDPDGVRDEGLIRPAADGEPEAMRKAVEKSGMVYVENSIGTIVGRILSRAGVDVHVEVMQLEQGEGCAGKAQGGGVGREGKLALGEWEIWNLRIVERPP